MSSEDVKHQMEARLGPPFACSHPCSREMDALRKKEHAGAFIARCVGSFLNYTITVGGMAAAANANQRSWGLGVDAQIDGKVGKHSSQRSS